MHTASTHELDDERVYTVIVSELVSEGGLGWTIVRGMDTRVRPLGVTCAEVVWDYLERIQSNESLSPKVPQVAGV